MQTVELKDAQSRLPELVSSLASTGGIIIETNRTPVARLLPITSRRAPRPLEEFAGKFKPLPLSEQENLKMHDKIWCERNS